VAAASSAVSIDAADEESGDRPVITDEGLAGYGSVFTNDHLMGAALDVLKPLYQGENALEPERVSEKLHQNTFWLGRGGSLSHAISGIDIALWDVFGQATGQPIGRLLGGRYRDRVRPYASVLMEQPQPLAEHLRAIQAQGFRALPTNDRCGSCIEDE
jgi:L-alanine-DL-glutamate epimerase-like enolase superfamily enzyme